MTELSPIGQFLPRRKPNPNSPDEAVLSQRDQLVLELVELGIGVRKAENLVTQYSEELIRKQLKWLPLRTARRPASLLIASIENDYDPPAYAD